MNANIGQRKRIFFCSGAVTLVAAAILAQPSAVSQAGGTDILHLFLRETMISPGTATNAHGRVVVSQNRQGRADNQQLDMYVDGLVTNAPYQLLSVLDDDTNFTFIAEFQSDSQGRATLLYRKRGAGDGKHPLPTVLNPVSRIRELDILDSSTQVVLAADLTEPDQLQFLIKRDLSTATVDAGLRIKATLRQTQFRLTATGLDPATDYFLVLNGGIVQTNRTDMAGKLVIASLLENPPDILKVRSVAVWDSANNPVLSTQLP